MVLSAAGSRTCRENSPVFVRLFWGVAVRRLAGFPRNASARTGRKRLARPLFPGRLRGGCRGKRAGSRALRDGYLLAADWSRHSRARRRSRRLISGLISAEAGGAALGNAGLAISHQRRRRARALYTCLICEESVCARSAGHSRAGRVLTPTSLAREPCQTSGTRDG